MNTIDQLYQSNLEVMKSKFISILMPLDNPDDFKEILKQLQKEHRKARHIVYAYRVGQKTKSCDDGEPKGTAGRPLLEFLLKKDLDHVALIVVRYFGGTKLGASRLLRTYLQAGIDVVNSANILEEK
ncbi:MAG: YigZ family protein [Bacilli bacterium]|nr:YigZ family protein [Bacilli bacterium]